MMVFGMAELFIVVAVAVALVVLVMISATAMNRRGRGRHDAPRRYFDETDPFYDEGEKKRKTAPAIGDEGIRDLLRQGRKTEAIDLYARFAGVDEYTARDAVEDIAQEMEREDDGGNPIDEDGSNHRYTRG